MSKLCCISESKELNIITIEEGAPLVDDSLIREALTEAERSRKRRDKRRRMVRWNDLERELAQRALTELDEDTGSDE